MVVHEQPRSHAQMEHGFTRMKFTLHPDFLTKEANGHCKTLFAEFKRTADEAEAIRKIGQDNKDTQREMGSLWAKSGDIVKLLNQRLIKLHHEQKLFVEGAEKHLDVGTIHRLKKIEFGISPALEGFDLVIHGEE